MENFNNDSRIEQGKRTVTKYMGDALKIVIFGSFESALSLFG
jgi:hypothetical protein